VAMPLAATAPVEAEVEEDVSVPAPGQATSAAGMTVKAAAERLIDEGAARAVFVSPEGDEAVAASVMVAREVADAGLRVIFLDLTQSCAASVAMLESSVYSGITNLLCSQAQFTDVIHADLYSDCHVIPVGTADTERAMRAIDRLPIIMSSLSAAYDLVVVECGPANSEGLRRVVDGESVLFVGAIEPHDDSVVEATRDLEHVTAEGAVRTVFRLGAIGSLALLTVHLRVSDWRSEKVKHRVSPGGTRALAGATHVPCLSVHAKS
jgi:Mrp family chromosome partitioning ATPase